MTYGYVTPYRRPLSWKRFRNQGSEMLSDLNRQINDLFEDVFDFDSDDDAGKRAMAQLTNVTPAIEVSHTDEDYLITAELPGVQEEDITLNVDEGVLTITGEKKRAPKVNDTGWSERSFGMFQRQIQLPQDVNEEQIEAEFIDGVLVIELPRVEAKTKGRRITLKASNERRETKLIDKSKSKVKANS